MALTLTLSDVTFTNLNIESGLEVNSSVNSSVGCQMRMSVQIEIGGEGTAGAHTLSRTRWYFNPALFVPPGQLFDENNKLTKYWYVELPASPAVAGYPMQLVGCGQNTESNKNTLASVEVREDGTAILSLQFRMTMDMVDFIKGLPVSNVDRFLRSNWQAPSQLTNTMASVYLLNRGLSWFLRVRGQSYTDPADVATVSAGHDFTSRWYDSGLYGAAPDLEDWECELSRSGTIVNDFSAFERTKVTCRWTCPAGVTPQDAFAYVVKATSPNQVGYLTDYGATGFTVANNGSTAQLNGVAYAPSTALVDTGGGLYETSFYVQGVDPSKTYGVIIVVGMAKDGSYERTNSFIRYPIRADGYPQPLQNITCTGSISDYNRTVADHARASVVDRLRLNVQFDYTNYEAELPSWSNGTFLDDLVRVKLSVYVDGDFLYDVLWPKQPDGTFLAEYLGEIIVDDLAEELTIEYSALMGYLNEAAGLENLAGKTVRYVWEMRLAYDALGGLAVDYQYEQKVVVDDYSSFAEVVQSVKLFDYDTGIPLSSLCGVDKVLVEVLLNPAELAGKEWDISAFASLHPHGYAIETGPLSTAMNHGYPSPTGLEALTGTVVLAVSNGFTSNRATFVLDTTNMQDGEQYRVHVVVRPKPSS